MRNSNATLTLASLPEPIRIRRADLDGAVVVPSRPDAEVLYIELAGDDQIRLVDRQGRAPRRENLRLDFAAVVLRTSGQACAVYRMHAPGDDSLELTTQNGYALVIEDGAEEDARPLHSALRAVGANDGMQRPA